jgi:hypothetical protein
MAVHGPEKPTVPEAVRQILSKNYPMYQCLKMKLINYHSMAELIQPQVQTLAGRKASVNTLVVAIKRFSDTLEEVKGSDAMRALENARISLSSGIVDVTIKARKTDFPRIVKELTEMGAELSEFPNIFPLATSIKMILPAEEYETLRPKIQHLDVAGVQNNLAKLSLLLTPKAEKIPGIASYLTELLYRNGINIVDAFLGRDVIIIVNGSEGHLAYEVFQREIHPPA